MRNTVTVPKTEYQYLRQVAQRYKMLQRIFTLEFFEEPPVRDINQIAKEFQQTGLYNEKFLRSLKQGLKESSYFSPKSAR